MNAALNLFRKHSAAVFAIARADWSIAWWLKVFLAHLSWAFVR